jgi:hypothetical protein
VSTGLVGLRHAHLPTAPCHSLGVLVQTSYPQKRDSAPVSVRDRDGVPETRQVLRLRREAPVRQLLRLRVVDDLEVMPVGRCNSGRAWSFIAHEVAVQADDEDVLFVSTSAPPIVAVTTSPRLPLTTTTAPGALSPFALAKASASALSCWISAWVGTREEFLPALPRPSQSATPTAATSAPAPSRRLMRSFRAARSPASGDARCRRRRSARSRPRRARCASPRPRRASRGAPSPRSRARGRRPAARPPQAP